MNTAIKRELLEKIKQYRKIIISRHLRPDGDAVGSTLGLKGMLKLTYPEKEVLVINGDYGGYTAFLGQEDAQRDDEYYADALSIIIDTGTPDRISNKKYSLAKEVAVIDHHIEPEPFGDISWVEPDRSSACEMIADFYAAFKDELKMDADAATKIYAGMVTDSGRFRYESVTGETLRLAAMLMDMGIDLERLYANLYLSEYEELKYHSFVLNKMRLTKNGVAHFYISLDAQKKFGLTAEQACEAVSYLGGLKGSIIWLAFIENADGTVRVRLRSRFVTVNKLAEKYGGGGHACASGATLKNRYGIRKVLADADELIAEYKANNTDWM